MSIGLITDNQDVKTVEERFWSKVDIRGADECWLWTGAKRNRSGRYLSYGNFYVGGGHDSPVYMEAHRWAYQSVHGPLPAGIQVDHKLHCDTFCVNPAHLDAVTAKQNGENRKGLDRNNTSGVRGVSWFRNRSGNGRWCAKVTHHGRQVHAGYFDTKADAEQAVIAKRRELFTHNHRDRQGEVR